MTNGTATLSTISFSVPSINQLRVLLERGTVSVTSNPTNPFTVTEAALFFSPFTLPRTTVSRVNVTVNVFNQATAGQIDALADNAPLTLSLRKCTVVGATGSTCLSSTFVKTIGSGSAQDGVITFNDVSAPADSNLFFRVVNDDANRSAIAGNSVFFSPDEAYLSIQPDRTTLFVGQPLDYFIQVRSVSTGVIDPTADDVGYVLRLRRCNGFIDNQCATWTDIDNNFANGTIHDGVRTQLTVINNPGTQLYVQPTLDLPYSFIEFNYYLTVYANNSVRPSFTYQGRPAPISPLLALPIRVILTPTSGGAARDSTVSADGDGVIRLISNVVPGTYTVTIKHASALARQVTGVVVTAPGTINVAMGEFKPGDANNDNTINLADFTVFAATFGKTSGQSGYNGGADFNGDTSINLADFTLLAANFGSSGAPLP